MEKDHELLSYNDFQNMIENAHKAGACRTDISILKSFKSATEFVNDVLAPVWALWYAENVLKGKFEQGEILIAKDSYCSYNYVKYVLKGRFELGEKAISENAILYDEYKEFLDDLARAA